MKKSIFFILSMFTIAFLYLEFYPKRQSLDNSFCNEKDCLIVGTNAEFKPFAFIEDDGSITGFDADVMYEITKILKKKVIFKDLPFEALIAELHNHSIDCIASGINPTAERAKQVVFSTPIYESDPLVIVSLKNTPYTSIESLFNKKVLVNEGYFADSFLSDYKNIELIRLSSNLTTDGLLALQNERANAFVASKSTTIPLLSPEQQMIFNITILTDVIEKDAIVLAKENTILIKDINHAIDIIKTDGTLNNLIKKWFPGETQ